MIEELMFEKEAPQLNVRENRSWLCGHPRSRELFA